MIGIGRRMDVKVQALLTDMDQPLGFTIGNALEIMEASQTLQGQGPPRSHRPGGRSRGAHDLHGQPADFHRQRPRAANTALEDGSALEVLSNVIAAQGGNANVLQQFESLPNASGEHVITSPRDGYISRINADDIGRAAVLLGAGRTDAEDKIDPAVGIVLQAKVGDNVVAGSGLCALYYTDETNLAEAVQLVEDAFRLSANVPEPRDLVLDLIQ